MPKINRRETGGGARGMSDKEAQRILKAEKDGREVPDQDRRAARKTAADHYRTQADQAERDNDRRRGRGR